jgi:hypothetical protein
MPVTSTPSQTNTISFSVFNGICIEKGKRLPISLGDVRAPCLPQLLTSTGNAASPQVRCREGTRER